MTNRLFIRIKGETTWKDVFTQYGVSPVRGFYEALLQPAPLKESITVASRLLNGERVLADTTNTRYASRQVTLPLFMEATSETILTTRFEAFFAVLASGLVEWRVVALNKRFTLKYTDCNTFQISRKRNYVRFDVRCLEPDPTDRSL